MSNPRTLKDWFIALRPWSFSTSAIPVIATLAFVCFASHHDIDLGSSASAPDYANGFLSLLMIMLLHGGGNLVSDYYDHVRRVDLPGCPNGVHWISSGVFRPCEILVYGLLLLVIGAAVGVLILFRSDIEVLWIGVLAVALPLGYPWLKAHALGDVDILLCFSVLPALGTCFVMTGVYYLPVLFLSLPYGLLTVSILHANNTRDRANDRRAGLLTLPLILGWQASRRLYVAYLVVPYLLVLFVMGFYFGHSATILCLLLVLLTLPVAVRNIRAMMTAETEDRQDIGALDQMSAQLQLVFGLSYSLGFALASFV